MNLSLQMPLTMAATGTFPFNIATRASPVSKMAGVVTIVRCSGGSFQTGTLTLSFGLSLPCSKCPYRLSLARVLWWIAGL